MVSLYHVPPFHSTKQNELFTFLTEFSTASGASPPGFHGVFHLFHRVFNIPGEVFPIRIVMLRVIFWIFLEIQGRFFCFFQKNGDRKFSVFPPHQQSSLIPSPIWNIYAGEVFNIPHRPLFIVENFIHKGAKIRKARLGILFAAFCPHDLHPRKSIFAFFGLSGLF